MTYKQAKEELAKIGMSLRSSDGEFRVNIRGGAESTAYYTNDLSDAVETGKAMAKS